MEFINRKNELDSMNNKWAENRAHFIVIYGKRRVGKTELIKQFIKNKPSVYFLSDKRTMSEQLKEIGALFGNHFQDSYVAKQGFSEWLDVFKYLNEKTSEPFVFAVDEYPYLVETDKSISSIFQKGWDEYLKNSKIFFVLSGSSISMMESELLIYKAPLYGRRTGQILVKPLSFKESRGFFSAKSFDEFLSIFAVTGGLPAYLLQMNPKDTFNNNIINKIFKRTEYLHNEVEFVIKEELREPKNYLSILKAISFGKRKFGEIANDIGLEKNILTKYLQTLINLLIIEKEVPVTEKNQQKSRKGLYRITDNYFRFWFQYVFPYKSDLEIERYDEVLRKIDESFNILKSFTYEDVCRENMWELRSRIFNFERIGKWWQDNEEIDIVGTNDNTGEIVFGEVKWSEKLIGTNVFDELKRKAGLVQWGKPARKEYYILFSKSGFTKDMLAAAKQENVLLVCKDRIVD